MASLRDVFNHAGKPCTLERAGKPVGQALVILRGSEALLEPKVDPKTGDVVRLANGPGLVVTAVVPQHQMGKLDHYRITLRPG